MTGILAPIYDPAGGAGVPQLDAATITAVNFANYVLQGDGDIFKVEDAVSSDTGDDWIAPLSGMALFEVKATLVSVEGNMPTGTFGAWLALGGGDRTWSAASSTGVNCVCSITLEIRRIGTVLVLAAATIDLQAYDGVVP